MPNHRSSAESPATGGGVTGLVTEDPPLTPQEAAAELGVSLTQRLQPNLRDQMPKRFVTRAEAQARGWSWFYIGDACRFGHQAARRTANPKICSDCERTKAGEETVYGKSRAQTFYAPPKPKDPAATTAAPVVLAPPAPPEPSAADQKFLAALDELRDFDAAAEAVGTKRGLIEARVSSNEVFRKALTDLCERRGIAWTRAPDAGEFQWTPEIERQLVRRFVDTGLLHTAREELRISASDYQDHLSKCSDFAAAVEGARPFARETLRERAIQAADRGNDRLAKLLEDDPEVGVFTDMSGRKHPYVNPAASRAEIEALLSEVKKKLGRRVALERMAVARTSNVIEPTQSGDSHNTDLVAPHEIEIDDR